ncbi:hypothetical protein BDY21DRAFT_213108 [Lineolata rhizophorae]|uniref:DUF6594 domain-containing protein n=1 Tax=Lineolata rhizophorae TaxID=578093 RepID=A0A6A6P2N8_9PEZI|nr:hypothetical protein BDY21DRAFT_213108 [Lineolata rhizophorae]
MDFPKKNVEKASAETPLLDSSRDVATCPPTTADFLKWIFTLGFWKREPPVDLSERMKVLNTLCLDDFEDGYPRFAAWLVSDPNFTMFRRFKYMRARSLLHLQDKIAMLEDKLKKMDKEDFAADPYILVSRRWDEAQPSSKRDELISEVNVLFKEYDQLLFQLQSLNGIESPRSRNFESVFNELEEKKPMVQSERKTFYQKDDFVSLANGRENTWLHEKIEDFLIHLPQGFAQVSYIST